MQDFVVAVVVIGCALYAAWTLMPASWRRALAKRAAPLPLPARARSRLQRIAQSAPGCGCDGCDSGGGAPAAKAGEAQPIRFVRKPNP